VKKVGGVRGDKWGRGGWTCSKYTVYMYGVFAMKSHIINAC
jgi:hypothetical protein